MVGVDVGQKSNGAGVELGKKEKGGDEEVVSFVDKLGNSEDQKKESESDKELREKKSAMERIFGFKMKDHKSELVDGKRKDIFYYDYLDKFSIANYEIEGEKSRWSFFEKGKGPIHFEYDFQQPETPVAAKEFIDKKIKEDEGIRIAVEKDKKFLEENEGIWKRDLQ